MSIRYNRDAAVTVSDGMSRFRKEISETGTCIDKAASDTDQWQDRQQDNTASTLSYVHRQAASVEESVGNYAERLNRLIQMLDR